MSQHTWSTPLKAGNPLGFWDTKGVRVYFSKDTGVVDHFDCVLVPGRGLPDLDPKQPFTGVRQVEAVDISKKTTKAALRLQDATREIVLPWSTERWAASSGSLMAAPSRPWLKVIVSPGTAAVSAAPGETIPSDEPYAACRPTPRPRQAAGRGR